MDTGDRPDDYGTHTVCAKLDKEFMDYSKSMGNDLYGVAQPGTIGVRVNTGGMKHTKKHRHTACIRRSSNKRTKRHIIKNIFKSNKRKKYKRM